MNALEIQYLNKSNLSHIARSLYMLYLRPRAEQNQCLTDLSSIASYLSSDSTYFPTTPNFEIACLVLDELEHTGLIKKENEEASWQGNTFILPLFIKEIEELPSKPFYMTNSWRPTASFHEACVLCGIILPYCRDQSEHSLLNKVFTVSSRKKQRSCAHAHKSHISLNKSFLGHAVAFYGKLL